MLYYTYFGQNCCVFFQMSVCRSDLRECYLRNVAAAAPLIVIVVKTQQIWNKTHRHRNIHLLNNALKFYLTFQMKQLCLRSAPMGHLIQVSRPKTWDATPRQQVSLFSLLIPVVFLSSAQLESQVSSAARWWWPGRREFVEYFRLVTSPCLPTRPDRAAPAYIFRAIKS